jgi:hypothetical protein
MEEGQKINTMAATKRKRTKGQTMVDKTQQRN